MSDGILKMLCIHQKLHTKPYAMVAQHWKASDVVNNKETMKNDPPIWPWL